MEAMGFILVAYLQIGMLSGAGYIPVDGQFSRDRVQLPPQYIRLHVEGERTLGRGVSLVAFGGSETNMTMKDALNFSPFAIAWDVGVRIQWENVTIGWTRECHHPFESYMIERSAGGSRIVLPSNMEGFSHDIYVRIGIGGETK